MRTKILVIASQDYKNANHKGLWEKLAEKTQEDVIVVNIPADRLVSTLMHHKDRIEDSKQKPHKINNHLTVVRPLLTVRPEVLPDQLFPVVAKEFWRYLDKAFPDLKECRLRIIVYNAYWVKILKKTRNNIFFAYYLFDEVRYNGKDNSINKKRYVHDEYACKNSDIVFAMSEVLAKSRSEYNDNIVVIGNGALKPKIIFDSVRKFTHSFAFVGNFRNWIDEDLLRSLISKRKDILFVFAGTIENDMREFLRELLDSNMNTVWFGRVQKNNMGSLYRMFDGLIIPYKNNDFIRATRPIKIVESVLAGTPVVTIPMNGYKENSFIRFADSVEAFSRQINYLLDNPIDQDSDEYKEFVKTNTWDYKAEIIIKEFDRIGEKI